MEEGFLWSSSLTKVFFSCVLPLFARWQPLSLSYTNKKYHTYAIHLTTIYTRSNFHLLNFVYDSNKIGNGRTRIEGEFEYYLIEWESQERITESEEKSNLHLPITSRLLYRWTIRFSWKLSNSLSIQVDVRWQTTRYRIRRLYLFIDNIHTKVLLVYREIKISNNNEKFSTKKKQ